MHGNGLTILQLCEFLYVLPHAAVHVIAIIIGYAVTITNIKNVFRLQISKKLKTAPTDSKLKELNTKLQAKCKELGYNLGESKNFKTRNKQVVAKCFNKIGIVVPVDQNDVGYRPLPMTNSKLCVLLYKSKLILLVIVLQLV